MKNELYHSNTYLGQDYSDGIRHFKYIKREMKNGRWVYYYSHDEYNKAKKNLSNSKSNYKKASELSRQANETYNNKHAKLGQANLGYQLSKIPAATEKNPFKKLKAKKANKEYEAEYDKALKEYNKASSNKRLADANAKLISKEVSANKKAYESVAKKTKVQRALGKGVVKVANAASNAGYKAKQTVKKGKKAVAKAWDKIYTSEAEANKFNNNSKNHTGLGIQPVKTNTKKKKKK